MSALPLVQPRDLDRLLEACVQAGASDLHLAVGSPPLLRVHGELQPLPAEPPLSEEELEALLRPLLEGPRREALRRERSLDLARSHGGSRFRLNVFNVSGAPALAARRLEERIRSLEELGLPDSLRRLTELRQGLVLVCGATGSGKSTTLATLIDGLNAARPCHVITLEDPIEYVHPSRRALVRQRELHTDFADFASALRAALREDPDVILVGELRDTETMRAALTAAETGHLVLSTLHSGSALEAPERLIGAFPGDERDSVRHQLALVLRAVLAQRLVLGAQGQGRTPLVELLWVTRAVSHLIRSDQAAQLASAMEGGAREGMIPLEGSLADAVRAGRVELAEARRQARSPRQLEERLRLAGHASSQGRVAWQ